VSIFVWATSRSKVIPNHALGKLGDKNLFISFLSEFKADLKTEDIYVCPMDSTNEM
jgi:hypothetical protein